MSQGGERRSTKRRGNEKNRIHLNLVFAYFVISPSSSFFQGIDSAAPGRVTETAAARLARFIQA